MIGHPLFYLFDVELGMGMVAVVGRMDWVLGAVDGIVDIVRLLSLVGEGGCLEACSVTCSAKNRGRARNSIFT